MSYYNEFRDGPARYYQNRNTGQVIGMVYDNKMYFHHNSLNDLKELLDVYHNLIVDDYSEIVVPKEGTKIKLIRNNINPFSPHSNQQFIVKETQDFRVILSNTETNNNLVIDLRNWVWENVNKKSDVDIRSGDIIEKDGKKYKIILEEYIPPPKYKIGEIIGDGNVIVNTSCSGTTRYYTVYLKHEDELHMKSESEIESLK